jgi:class 3 adenylate cyclase
MIFHHTRGVVPPTNVPSWALYGFAITNIIVSFVLMAVVSYSFSSYTEQADDALAREHERSEGLLHNILPATIATRLKAGEEPIADGVQSASVLFADIVGFTALSAKMSADDLVNLLNEIFSRIDERVAAHGLEKIKTIGDAYMVAAGIPESRDDHAEAITRFALELPEALRGLDHPDVKELQLRIGIHSGPVVTGVIGKRKFSYDLWGDTVNTASRMESHGVAGRIQISEATRALLDDRFELTERGPIDVKGKGEMTTWFVVGPR